IEGVSLFQQGGWGRLRIHITLDAVTGGVFPEFAASIGGSSAPRGHYNQPTR
ncbi:unnamed protein product, partial [Ectocarpus sp. 8 AP-2014]